MGDAAEIKSERDLTVLLTTHYMDEADKLCDRIAIVDHGKLVALDTPARLKASIPGTSEKKERSTTCSCTTPGGTCAMRCRRRRRLTPVHDPEAQTMHALGLIERELRRFSKSPMLIIMSMTFPLLQLIVLGYAFGGNVKHLTLAIVDQDRGVPAVRLREMAGAVSSGAQTIHW